MTKNPFLNAFLASLYITLISSLMFLGTRHAPKEDSILAPIAMISLFTLSAAIMAYLFCYQPLNLFLNNKVKAAVTLFLQTTAIFSLFTLIFLVALFTGVLS